MPSIIDPDICKARTLPSSFYTDDSRFAESMKKIRESWHFAGHICQLENFTAIPVPHLEYLMGSPILLTRSDRPRCISNVCTHRGMIIANEPSNNQTLQCPYHGRTFSLDGCFKSMPEFERVESFPAKEDDLENFQTLLWNGLLFVGSKTSEMTSFLQELGTRLDWLDIQSFEHDHSRYRSYEIEANWALYVDNYLEGFHIPFVHSDLNDGLDYDDYMTEIFHGGVLQIGIASPGEPFFDLPKSSPDFGLRVAAYYYWLFPGLMLNFYPWGLSVNIVVPISTNRTRIIYHGFIGDKSLLNEGAGSDLDKVEAEDQEIVEATQRGVSARSYDRGRYSPKKEIGVHHFHRILTKNSHH